MTDLPAKKRGRPHSEALEPPSKHRQSGIQLADEGESESDSDDKIIKRNFELTQVQMQQSLSLLPKPDFGDEPHMWFQTTQVMHIRTIFKCLSKVLKNEMNFVIGKTGWRLTAMSPSRSMFVDLRITDELMQDGIYDCNHNYFLCIPVHDFADRLHYHRKAYAMTMYVSGNDPDILNIIFAYGKRTTTMHLVLRTPQDEHATIPPIHYNSEISLEANELRDVLSGMKSDMLIEQVSFQKSANRFSIIVDTKDHGPIRSDFKYDEKDEDPLIKFFDTGDGRALSDGPKWIFLLQDLKRVTDVTKATKWAQINLPELTEDGQAHAPLRLTYALAALGTISFYVSVMNPIDEEDE